jgi:hypothetical protein
MARDALDASPGFNVPCLVILCRCRRRLQFIFLMSNGSSHHLTEQAGCMVRRAPLLLGCITFLAITSLLFLLSSSSILATPQSPNVLRLKPLFSPVAEVKLQTSFKKPSGILAYQRSAAPAPVSTARAAHADAEGGGSSSSSRSADHGDFQIVK